MIAIALTFPAGRFHATPWGRHVNEGAPEWPPSPWRILRSLVATWKRKLDDRITTDQIRPILAALAEPPAFHLPRASTGHTRHFMPLRFPDLGDRTKVFDAFVVVPRTERLVVLWPGVTLSADARGLLQRVLRDVGFLGRAESWCEAALLDDAEASTIVANCIPLNGERPSPDQQIVRLMCAHRAAAFDNAHTPKVPTAAGGKGRAKGEAKPLYDPDWHLCLETSELHDKRWSDPPGSVWVRYVRRSDCFKPVVPTSQPRRQPDRSIQVARFALDSSVLPLAGQTLLVAETARRMLMYHFVRAEGRRLHREVWTYARYKAGELQVPSSGVFAGKSADGTPARDHRHAYFLPTDEDGDGRLDHLTVVAADGFGDGELRALDELRELKSREREESGQRLRVVLLGLGSLTEYSPMPLRASAVWVSASPFIANIHPHRRDSRRPPQEFLEVALRRELDYPIDWSTRPR